MTDLAQLVRSARRLGLVPSGPVHHGVHSAQALDAYPLGARVLDKEGDTWARELGWDNEPRWVLKTYIKQPDTSVPNCAFTSGELFSYWGPLKEVDDGEPR